MGIAIRKDAKTGATMPSVERHSANATEDRKRLRKLEAKIELGFKGCFEVGKALIEIETSKLYEVGFSTFEDYCRLRLGLSRSHVYRWIEAAKVIEHISAAKPTLPLPTNEYQVRKLKSLPASDQVPVWEAVVQRASVRKEPISARQVEEVAKEFSQPHENGSDSVDGNGERQAEKRQIGSLIGHLLKLTDLLSKDECTPGQVLNELVNQTASKSRRLTTEGIAELRDWLGDLGTALSNGQPGTQINLRQ